MASLTYHTRSRSSLDWINEDVTLSVSMGDGSHIDSVVEDRVLSEEAAPPIEKSTIIPTGGNISVREILNTHNTYDRSVVTEMVRFTKHMLAIYTWRLYIYERPGTGLCKLGYHKCMDRSHAPHGPGHPMDGGEVIGENFLNLHRISMMAQVGFDTKEQELVYASFQVGLEEGPYCIIIDHVWKSVVVTIRGSITLEDVVTDLQLAPESLEDIGQTFGFDGKDQYCHRGFLVRSKWIYNDLER
jgi:sn1-specific diacylglycerol lipase